MVTFTDMFLYLERLGIGDSLLPFFLIFVLVYAVLMKTNIMGPQKTNFNVVLSFILAMLVIIPHITGRYPPNQDIVNIINTAVPNVMVLVVAVTALMLLTGMFGYAPLKFAESGFFSTVFILSAFGAIVYFFGLAAGFWSGAELPPILGFLQDPDTQGVLLVVAAFGLVLMFVTGGGPDAGTLKGAGGAILGEFKKLLGGGP